MASSLGLRFAESERLSGMAFYCSRKNKLKNSDNHQHTSTSFRAHVCLCMYMPEEKAACVTQRHQWFLKMSTTLAADRQHARIPTEIWYLPTQQPRDMFFPELDTWKRTSGSSPPGLTSRSFDRNTKIYPAFWAENYCEFVNQIHSWEAGVWVVLYPPQNILQIWSLVSRSWNNTDRAQDLGIKIQPFHSIFFHLSLS